MANVKTGRVLVTGAGGFIGQVLIQRLLTEGLNGSPVERLTAVDLSLAGLPQDARLQPVIGSIADVAVLASALSEPVDAVFHLASVPGGAAEKSPALARRVNLDATMQLLELLEHRGNAPRLVFASTIAVYGQDLPLVIDEDTLPCPVMGYGAHKLAAEIMITDATRRRVVRGCSLRLPGVVARPGDGAGLVSAFMSQVFWRLRAGEAIELPVTADGMAWWISSGVCVDNLLHAARIDTEKLGARAVVQMPALHLAMSDVVAALARAYGDDRHALVSHAPQPWVQRLFASYPPLSTPRALAMGFTHDGSADALVRRAMES